MDGGRRRRGSWPRDRVLAVLVPLVLVVVAGTQVVVANSTDLTAWRGGGFGMFSTIDAHSTRFLRATVTLADGRSLPTDLASLTEDPGFRDAFVVHGAWPRDGTAEDTGRALGRLPLVEDDGVVLLDLAVTDPPAPGPAERDAPVPASLVTDDGTRRSIGGVTIEVWSWSLDRTSGELSPRRLHRREVEP